MHVNNRGRIVLRGLLADKQRIAERAGGRGGDSGRGAAGLSRQQRGRQRLLIDQAQAGLVAMNLVGWLGREPTNSERVLFHREYLRLEDMGLIERCNLHGGRRTTHLRLTQAGWRLAEDLLLAPCEDAFSEVGTNEGADEALIDLDAIEFVPIELPDEPLTPESCG